MRETGRETAHMMAEMMVKLHGHDNARYIVVCYECNIAWPYQRDCKTTKAVRDGTATCPECETALGMAVDAKEDER